MLLLHPSSHSLSLDPPADPHPTPRLDLIARLSKLPPIVLPRPHLRSLGFDRSFYATLYFAPTFSEAGVITTKNKYFRYKIYSLIKVFLRLFIFTIYID